jgi:hypothetical protein
MVDVASRRRALLIGVVLLASARPCPLGAQPRVVQRHRAAEQEGRLMAFYSGALAFTPVGAPSAVVPWVIEIGGEAGYIPWLSAAQRRVESDKPQATNLLPVAARLRMSVALPRGIRAEAGWVPPVRVVGVRGNLVGLALSRTSAITPALALTPRVSALAGYAEAAITCYSDLASGSVSQRTYFRRVCFDHESKDRFEPRHLSAELVATYGRGWRMVPYAGLGARLERTRFDIGVIDSLGVRDPDHPILELRATRGYGFAGATWVGGTVRLSGELYYAPGSLLTGRVAVAKRLRER